jgi:hypothetical protein
MPNRFALHPDRSRRSPDGAGYPDRTRTESTIRTPDGLRDPDRTRTESTIRTPTGRATRTGPGQFLVYGSSFYRGFTESGNADRTQTDRLFADRRERRAQRRPDADGLGKNRASAAPFSQPANADRTQTESKNRPGRLRPGRRFIHDCRDLDGLPDAGRSGPVCVRLRRPLPRRRLPVFASRSFRWTENEKGTRVIFRFPPGQVG